MQGGIVCAELRLIVVVKHTSSGGGRFPHTTLFCLCFLSPGFLSAGRPDFNPIVARGCSLGFNPNVDAVFSQIL